MSDMPQRIQRSRAKGWRKPEGAVVVSRPSIFGNPFPVDVYGYEGAVDRFRRLLEGQMSTREMSESSLAIDGSLVTYRQDILRALPRLRGKDLCCWCAPGWTCHADVLLRLANEPAEGAAR